MPQVPARGNADMGPAEVREHCVVDGAGKSPLRAAMQAHQGGSADERMGACRLQTIDRILKLARTIADPSFRSGQAWQGGARTEAPHVAEAIQYRPRRML